jgi:uncharacterized membrane protein (UPF0182 family)
MYTALLLLLIAFGAFLVITGLRSRGGARVVGGVLVGVFTFAFFSFLGFWGEMLWFDALGYGQRFWTVILAKTATALAGVVAGGLLVSLLRAGVPREHRRTRFWSRLLGGFLGGMWGLVHWDTVLRYARRVSTGVTDPILGRDAGFYLFTLPFYDAVYILAVMLTVTALGAVFISLFVRLRGGELAFAERSSSGQPAPGQVRSLYVSAAVLVFLLAAGKYLSRFHLMYSTWGAVSGPGWTDVNIRLPAYSVAIVLTLAVGLVLLIGPLRRRVLPSGTSTGRTSRRGHIAALGAAGGAVIGVWFITLTVVPSLFQWLRVEPNEITFEAPYIAHNIEFTRRGFRLHEVEEREFPASQAFTEQVVQRNKNLFSNIRLWDWRALEAVYQQFQEIRLYYEFVDVDIDRYTIGDSYRQVMVSARELNLDNLPKQSQTFVNRRFKYTHGNGITLTTVSEFTPEGLPNLLVKDVPPSSTYPGLAVEVPQIYYGELTRSHVIVNTKEAEFDYPKGEENAYIHYPGTGGVLLRGLWRKFLYGWKFDGTRFFLSGYPTSESRVLFHREINERIKAIAPFLHIDDDPYIVLADGRLYWIVDAYTTSRYYPYSEPFASGDAVRYRRVGGRRGVRTEAASYLEGINYIRNSVKAVIDAFNGTVDFYVFEPDDPVIRVWQKIFPDLFKPRGDMPASLLAHVRYPADMLLVQGLVYAKYHMSDPAVFYNQEDLWVRATEKYYDRVQPVEPYYIMWELPDSDESDFVLMLPFTPKNRQVLIGWIAGMCDRENYGRFLAYKFPKERRVLGPQQVETKIDQDPHLSGQLTLWDQRGSNVIRGNVLAIPIEETLLYVEPIYLRAETAAYPELRLVALMHGDNLSYGQTFEEALEGLLRGQPTPIGGREDRMKGATVQTLARRADEAFEDYLRLLGEKRFKEASDAMQNLQDALEELLQRTSLTDSVPQPGA